MRVDFLSVRLLELDGLYHQVLHKSQEPGTQEMMQIQQHNQSQDVPDGSCLPADNYRILDMCVELTGILIPPRSTGVVQSTIVATHGA